MRSPDHSVGDSISHSLSIFLPLQISLPPTPFKSGLFTHQIRSTDPENLRAFCSSFVGIAMSGSSAPLAPFPINETNSNFEQFQEKFLSVEENGLVDAHLIRFLRSFCSRMMAAYRLYQLAAKRSRVPFSFDSQEAMT
jgi:hypothetical protein